MPGLDEAGTFALDPTSWSNRQSVSSFHSMQYFVPVPFQVLRIWSGDIVGAATPDTGRSPHLTSGIVGIMVYLETESVMFVGTSMEHPLRLLRGRHGGGQLAKRRLWYCTSRNHWRLVWQDEGVDKKKRTGCKTFLQLQSSERNKPFQK